MKKYLVGAFVLLTILFSRNVFATCVNNGFTVVYVNGIFTPTKDLADQDRYKLADHFTRTIKRTDIKFITGYNESHIGGAGDLIESASQLLDSPVSNYDRNTILLQLHPEITTRKILLVGHSQGTFYTNEIYNYLLANGEQKETVGMYNVATPASYVSGSGSYLTSENDKVINSVRNIASKIKAKQPLPANINISLTPQEAADSFGGHSFSGVYLAGASGRIVSEINDSLKKLSVVDSAETSVTEVPDTADADCFTPPPRNIAYYAQKAAFSVADTTANGVIAASNGVVAAGETAYAVGKTVYNGTLALGQSVVKIAETVYTSIEKFSVDSLSKSSALIANNIGIFEQQDNDAVTTDNDSENQNASNDILTEEENLSQPASGPSPNTENEISAISQDSSTSLEIEIPDSESEDSQSGNQGIETNISTSSPQVSPSQATTTQNNNVSGGGGNSASPTGGVSVVQASSVSASQVSLAITEIMYDAPGADAGHEWIEIFNNGTSSADITKLKFFESGTNHNLNVAQGSSTLTPGSYAVITDDSSKFISDYPSYVGQLFGSSFSLSNNGETITIKNSDTIVDEITYSSSTGANGDGNSLQLINGLWQATLPTSGKENKIANKPPTALFKFSPASPKASDTISFDASSSTDPDGSIISYSWNFGDGQSTTTNQAITAYSYGSVGSYIVQLTPFDNSGASSTATSTISVASSSDSNASSSSATSSESNHIVISEIQVKGDVADDEFIEFYNPTNSVISLNGYSIQYLSGTATSTNTISTSGTKKNFSSGAQIPAKGFYLIVNSSAISSLKNKADMTYSSFNLSGSSNGATIFLVSATMPISNINDPTIIDNLSYGNPQLAVSAATSTVPDSNKSLERKSFSNNTCASAQASSTAGEFLGNGCDTDNASDFEIRNSPNPRNSGSLPEPRSAPSINNLQITYNFAPRFDFSWDLSSDSAGATSTISYSVHDAGSTSSLQASATGSTSSPQASSILILETASATSTIATSTKYSVNEVGRNYSFQFSVKDRDGLSNSTTTTVLANSFLDNFYFYRDPRPSSTAYFFDVTTTSSRPFWDATNAGGYGGWKAIIFYLNKDAPKEGELSTYTNNQLVPSDNSYVRVSYGGCVGGVNSPQLIFPLNSASCVPGPFSAGSYNFAKLEDARLTVSLSSSTSDISFSSNDYVTLAFYDFVGGGSQLLRLDAVDKTKYYFKDTPQNQNAPTTPGNFSANFATSTGMLNLSWSSSTDADTLDYLINYQVNYSTSSALSDSDWQSVGTSLSASTVPIYPNTYKIGVRAIDNFNNTSTPAVVDWNFPSGFVQLPSQLNHDNIISTTNGAQKFFVSYSASISAAALFVGPDGGSDSAYSQSYIEIRKDNDNLVGALVATSAPQAIWQNDAQGEIVYTLNSPVQLEASSSYWIVAVRGPSQTSGTKYYGSISNPYPGGYWSNNTAYDIYFRLVQ